MLRKRILIIDDDIRHSRLVKQRLEVTGGFEVRDADRGQTGLALARQWKPELILLDMQMPEMDGAEVVTALKADPALAGIPVVFMTSLVSPEDGATDLLQRGGQYYLTKTARLSTLVVAIERMTTAFSSTTAKG